MKSKQRVQIESPTSEIRRVVVESGDERELYLIRINNARKRRLKVKQQRKNACMHAHENIKNGTLENELGLRKTVSYGLVSVVGKRKEMEDAVRAELGFVEREHQKFDFFGVYDGHGGARVAEACREMLHEVVAAAVAVECCGEGEFWERVMEKSFVKMDELVMGDERICDGGGGDDGKASVMRTMGSTALVAVLGRDVLVVANCGDSRAVMSRDGVALALSEDHKPNRPDELQRIESAGGRVINWNGHRVLGVLATSRSIGDQYLKPYVIPKPEVIVYDRANSDEFLILASDGLWDVISNDIACQVVRRYLNSSHQKKNSQDYVRRSRTAKAAAALTELAMCRGSTDNISVIVVDLGQC